MKIEEACDQMNRDPSGEAALFLKAQAEKGDVIAMACLAKNYDPELHRGSPLNLDPVTMLGYAQTAAKANQGDACYALFLAYANGEWVSEDDDLADEYFEKAARLGQFDAIENLADSILDHDLDEEERDGASELLEECIEKTGAIQLLSLAQRFQEGEATLKMSQLAFKCLKGAAKAGIAQAQRMLGDAYAQGVGTLKDLSKAVEYWTMAAKQDDLLAIDTLVSHYSEGDESNKDLGLARVYLMQAARLGDSDALTKLQSLK